MVCKEKDGGVCFPLVSNFLRTSHPYYTVETFKHNPPTYASSTLVREYPASYVLATAYGEQEPQPSPSREALLDSPHTAPTSCPCTTRTLRGDSQSPRGAPQHPNGALLSPHSPRTVLRDGWSIPLAMLRAPLAPLKVMQIFTPLSNY